MLALILSASIALGALEENQASIDQEKIEILRTQYSVTAPIISKVEVAPGQIIHVEESGNPQGIPVVFFHGGPGAKFRSTDHQWFNPEKYRIIAFQQRGTEGCNPSAMDLTIPSQTFQDVTIQTLGEDIEVLRKHLEVDKWLVFGGSWGSTLAVYYAQEYPDRCLGLVVRGIFLATPKENALFFDKERHEKQCGIYWKPEALDRIINYANSKGFEVSLDDTPSIYAAYSKLCVNQNDFVAQRIWAAFEEFVDDPQDKDSFDRLMDDNLSITPSDHCVGIWETLLMDNVSRTYNLLGKDRLAKMQGIPIQIVQGGKDNLCHPSIAKELSDGLKDVGCSVTYTLVEEGPHSPYHPKMTDALIKATDLFANTHHF
ncbi:MAG: alpha/beta fold hydrolase [Verrucomicrobia bacterium]|nr:alpha/beta fold hydrolase [Verrucomicrobiota bacterium]